MKILISTPYDLSIPGGVNHQVKLLAQEFSKKNHSVVLCGPGKIDSDITFISTGKTFAFPFAHGSTANIQLKPQTQMLQKYLENKPDIILIHEPLMPGINWWLLKNTPGIPKVGTFHAYHPFNLKYFLGKPILNAYFKALNGWVCVSQAAQSNVHPFFKADYQITPNAIELPEIPANSQRQGLLFLGRFEPRKGLDTLIKAFNLVVDQKIELFVIGRGDPKPYQKLISPSHQSRVHFLGGVDNPTLKTYLDKCQIFISPARGYESFGIVLIEALSHGLPVIASDIPGYRDVIGQNQGGVLVPKDNPKALAEQIQKLLSDPQELQRMSKLACARAAEFDIQHTAQKYLDYFGKVKNVFR